MLDTKDGWVLHAAKSLLRVAGVNLQYCDVVGCVQMRLKEIKHARLAMAAFAVHYMGVLLEKKGVVVSGGTPVAGGEESPRFVMAMRVPVMATAAHSSIHLLRIKRIIFCVGA